MEDDNKPFACDALGCGMRFINEDHLMVHRKKHEMCLNLCAGSEPSSAKSTGTLYLDQTPTPTRFIRNCEEVGLFQDLQNVNPFDETFRKATEGVKTNSVAPNAFLPVTSTIDPLNTPSVLPLLDADTDADSTAVPGSPTHDDITAPDQEDLKSLPESTEDQSPLATTPSFPNRPPLLQISSVVSIAPELNPEDTQPECKPETVTAISSPVIVKNPNAVRPFVEKDNVPQQGPLTNSPIPVWQLLVKMPDGRSIPVNMPAIPLIQNTSPSVICQNTAVPIAPVPVPILPTKANHVLEVPQIPNTSAKMILMHGSGSTSLVSINGNATSVIAGHVDRKRTAVEKYSSGDEDSRSMSFRRSNDDDPDEKRKRFLERNRAAATRCRLKRKQKIMGLEKKAYDLSSTNLQLQNEVTLLRSEVAQLKTMLLAHRDCPVTLQQHELRNGAIGANAQLHVIDMSSAEAIASTALTSLATNASTTFFQAILAQTQHPSVTIEVEDDQTGDMMSEMASGIESSDTDSFSNDTK